MTHVMCVIGTRPEAIKVAPVIAELRAREGFDCSVCVSGQHRELLDDVLRVFDIVPDHDLDLMVADQTPSYVAAGVLRELDGMLADGAVDWLLVQGDTTTSMAAALAGFHACVRVAHLESGLRTGDLRAPFPEELNRRVVSIAAALHLAPTEIAAANLRAEGVAAADIVVTGNTVVDALLDVAAQPFDIAGTPLDSIRFADRRIVLLTAHRRESFGAPLERIAQAVRELAVRYAEQIEVVYPVHPNPEVSGVVHRVLGEVANVRLIEPLSYAALVHLLSRSTIALTDSGGIQEEAPTFHVPVLVLRDTTERVEAIDAGTATLVGTSPEAIIREASRLLDDPAALAAMAAPANPYGDGRARHRVVDAIQARS
jgi:UDP-N-acetylglucosamine 2-epimerase (non-hydrolysing)